jgi:hypothetical protein
VFFPTFMLCCCPRRSPSKCSLYRDSMGAIPNKPEVFTSTQSNKDLHRFPLFRSNQHFKLYRYTSPHCYIPITIKLWTTLDYRTFQFERFLLSHILALPPKLSIVCIKSYNFRTLSSSFIISTSFRPLLPTSLLSIPMAIIKG